ncbi:MAG: preprotein translocase subunit YajC [Hyphomicrobiales bacterium]
MDSNIIQFVPIIFIFVVMYFLVIRPQQKKVKQHRAMVDGIRRGDTVVTGGGLIGKVSKVNDEREVTIDLGEGIKVRIVRSMISEVRVKGEPVANDK